MLLYFGVKLRGVWKAKGDLFMVFCLYRQKLSQEGSAPCVTVMKFSSFEGPFIS